jgi:phospholipase C
MGRKGLVALQLLVTLGLLAAVLGTGHAEAKRKPKTPPPRGIHKIKHVIVIMQENRSFDSYFGTFPGADDARFAPTASSVGRIGTGP